MKPSTPISKETKEPFWTTYFKILSFRFKNTPRLKQEEFILRMSQIVTIGSALLALDFVYQFLPTQIRILILPVVAIGSWFIGTKILAPMMMARFKKYLNPFETA